MCIIEVNTYSGVSDMYWNCQISYKMQTEFPCIIWLPQQFRTMILTDCYICTQWKECSVGHSRSTCPSFVCQPSTKLSTYATHYSCLTPRQLLKTFTPASFLTSSSFHSLQPPSLPLTSFILNSHQPSSSPPQVLTDSSLLPHFL